MDVWMHECMDMGEVEEADVSRSPWGATVHGACRRGAVSSLVKERLLQSDLSHFHRAAIPLPILPALRLASITYSVLYHIPAPTCTYCAIEYTHCCLRPCPVSNLPTKTETRTL